MGDTWPFAPHHHPKLADTRPTKAWGSPDVFPTQLSAGSPLGGAGWPHPRLGYRRLSPVPLVSKICPSDTYKVWKSGQNLRVDTTLLGFDHMTWQRGNRSFVFRGQGEPARGSPMPPSPGSAGRAPWHRDVVGDRGHPRVP